MIRDKGPRRARTVLCLGLSLASIAGAAAAGDPAADRELRDRVTGLLIGSMIGDAAGGPVEFVDPQLIARHAPSVHRWEEGEVLDRDRRAALERGFRLYGYESLRPEPASYGPWPRAAAAGTTTDDTRHKVILMRALQAAHRDKRLPLRAADLARAYLDFPESDCVSRDAQLEQLCSEWLEEQNRASRWLLGQRNLAVARPPGRLWNGLPTVMGQMVLLPVAAIYPGRAADAYRATFGLAYFDNGQACDINAALVAGLSVTLVIDRQATAPDEAWKQVREAIGRVDPYGYGEIPFVGRTMTRWLETAHGAVAAAQNQPAVLFRELEERIRPLTWWEAQATFVTVMAILEFCPEDPLCAMQLALDFGHDTDSTAQLLGAFLGAYWGASRFADPMRAAVREHILRDYDEKVDAWVALLVELADEERYPRVIEFPDDAPP